MCAIASPAYCGLLTFEHRSEVDTSIRQRKKTLKDSSSADQYVSQPSAFSSVSSRSVSRSNADEFRIIVRCRIPKPYPDFWHRIRIERQNLDTTFNYGSKGQGEMTLRCSLMMIPARSGWAASELSGRGRTQV